MATAGEQLIKKSQSIKDLNSRLLQLAIEDVDIPIRGKKDRSASFLESSNRPAFGLKGL